MGFVFAFSRKHPCDIMIKFHLHTDGERAPALAKLVVDEKKEPEWLFF